MNKTTTPSKGRLIYTTEEGVIKAVAFIHENAGEITRRAIAEHLDIPMGTVHCLITAMKKVGVEVKSFKRASFYRDTIRKWAREEGLIK